MNLSMTVVYVNLLLTFANVLLALVPTVWIAVKHTMTIRASITAYSTAVGPSSHTRKRCIFNARVFTTVQLSVAVVLAFPG